jgi:pimeloyl-ACP methyl ester carboxylesterase
MQLLMGRSEADVPDAMRSQMRHAESVPAMNDLRSARVASGELRYLRRGAGQPLVLLHTLRTQLEYFLPLLRELDTTRFDVIVPDLPGHGRATAPRVAYTAEYFTDAVDELLTACGLRDAIVVGESIGGSIALGLAARHNPRVARAVALNPYDYGRWGGIRRSSVLANVLFTAMLWPGVGEMVARTGTKGVLRRVLEGGLHDPRRLPPELVDELYRCGSLPGHARAFRSLCLHWYSWIAARARYPAITVPVMLAYGDGDWSRAEEREANLRAIPGARSAPLRGCGHFSSLDRPQDVARIIFEGGT